MSPGQRGRGYRAQRMISGSRFAASSIRPRRVLGETGPSGARVRSEAMAAGPQHGYGIITDAGRISGGVTRLQTGTLYMALDRLRSAGLVEPDREEVADGRLRRYYRLTDEGAALLAAETERRRASAAVAAQRLSARLAGGTA